MFLAPNRFKFPPSKKDAGKTELAVDEESSKTSTGDFQHVHWPSNPGGRGMRDWDVALCQSGVAGYRGSAAMRRSSEKVRPRGPCGSKASGCYAMAPWSLCLHHAGDPQVGRTMGESSTSGLADICQCHGSMAKCQSTPPLSVGQPLRAWPVDPSGHLQSHWYGQWI